VNHVDSFGVGIAVYLGNGSFDDYEGRYAFFQDGFIASRWTVAAATQVSEPGIAALLGIGILAAAWSSRSRC